MIRLILILTALAALISCTPEKRLSRLIRNHPELIKSDTIWKNDTVRTELVKKDSSFYFYQRDTVLIKKGDLEIRYITNQDCTIYIEGRCLPRTIVTRRPYIVNTVTPVASASWWVQYLPILLCASIVYMAFRVRRQQKGE